MGHTAATVARLIQRSRFTYANEIELHVGLTEVVATEGLPVRREVRLTERDRLDLLVELTGPVHLGVEVKIAGANGDVHRQLVRYAASDQLDELMLVTTLRRHLVGLPAIIGGKPFTPVLLRGGLL